MAFVIVFSALGVALAIAFLSVASATVTWLRKSGNELQQRLMAAQENGDDASTMGGASSKSEQPSSILKKRRRLVDEEEMKESGFSVVQLEERLHERAHQKEASCGGEAIVIGTHPDVVLPSSSPLGGGKNQLRTKL